MIYKNTDEKDLKLINTFIKNYNDGDSEMSLPESIVKLDKPVLLYVISRLLSM